MKKYLPLFLLASQSYAASFVVPDGVTLTSIQSLANPGDTGLIEEGGAISTNGHCVRMQNIDQSVENNGDLTSANTLGGIGTYVIYVDNADNATVVNNGNINILGVTTAGVGVVSANNVTVVNNGNINITGDSNWGLYSDISVNVNITNNGNITSSGESGTGIFVGSSNSTAHNNGSIILNGSNSGGVGGGFFLPVIGNYVINNSGVVELNGDNSFGLYSFNFQNVDINNTGSASTTGALSNAVHIQGAQQGNFVNKGLIEATGAGSHGVFIAGNNFTTTNSGVISSTNGYALNFDGVGNTLALQPGSIIKGAAITTGDALDLEVARGMNVVLTLDDAGLGFGEITSSSPYVVVDNTAIFVDRTGYALEADLLADLSDAILGNIYQNCDCSCGTVAWVEGVGGHRKRLSSYCATDYTINDGGILAGLNKSFCSGCYGVFGGVVFGNAKVACKTSETDTVSYIAGVSFQDGCHQASLALGYVDYKNERLIANNLAQNGIEKAHSRNGSFLISPELGCSHTFNCYRVSALARYAGLFHGSCKESGSLYNLHVDDRSTQIITGRVELGVPYAFSCLSLEPYIGGYARWQIGNKDVDASIDDVRFSFSGACRSRIGAFLYGFRASRGNFFLNVEGSVDSFASNRVIGQAGFSKVF